MCILAPVQPLLYCKRDAGTSSRSNCISFSLVGTWDSGSQSVDELRKVSVNIGVQNFVIRICACYILNICSSMLFKHKLLTQLSLTICIASSLSEFTLRYHLSPSVSSKSILIHCCGTPTSEVPLAPVVSVSVYTQILILGLWCVLMWREVP